MQSENELFKAVVENISDGLYLVDKNRVITYWNKAAERITGFPAEEVIGRSCSDNILVHVDSEGNNLCKNMCPLAYTLCDGAARKSDIFLHHKDGHRVPVSVRVNSLTDDTGKITGGVELFTDISNQEVNRQRIAELEELALLDNLTKLANRHYIESELEKRLEEMRRYDMHFGLLFMDIDHFKTFNDTYGHDVGDAVLQVVAKTLISNSRPFDLYGRWGGEEFVGIIRNITAQNLKKLGQKTLHLVNVSHITHQGQNLGITISIGATVAIKSDTSGSLVKRADELLYRSKRAGRNRMTFG